MLPATIDHLYAFPIRSCGVAAFDLIARGGRGEVIAVFDTSFYFDVGGELACVVRADVPDGAMHIVVDFPKSLSWKSARLEVGVPVEIKGHRLRIGQAWSFDAASLKVWRPSVHQGLWTGVSLSCGIRGLKQISRSRLLVAGSAALSMQEFATPEVIRSLAALCGDDFEREGGDVEPKGLSAAIGLGEGLTPSGDDFLGGIMIALHAAGFAKACAGVWSIIGPVAKQATNTISFGHLGHAAQGQTIEPLHNLAQATLRGRTEEIFALADDVNRIGHTSGWDSVAGMICGFEAVEKAMSAG